jgi:hypothetical protein
LKLWLKEVADVGDYITSTANLRGGRVWQRELFKLLDKAKFAIACITPDNAEAPWIHFESGAVVKKFDTDDPQIFPICFGIGIRDISEPLQMYQGGEFSQKTIRELVEALWHAAGDQSSSTKSLRKCDEKWPELETSIRTILSETKLSELRKLRKVPAEALYDDLDRWEQRIRSVASCLGKTPPESDKAKGVVGTLLQEVVERRMNWPNLPVPVRPIAGSPSLIPEAVLMKETAAGKPEGFLLAIDLWNKGDAAAREASFRLDMEHIVGWRPVVRDENTTIWKTGASGNYVFLEFFPDHPASKLIYTDKHPRFATLFLRTSKVSDASFRFRIDAGGMKTFRDSFTVDSADFLLVQERQKPRVICSWRESHEHWGKVKKVIAP